MVRHMYEGWGFVLPGLSGQEPYRLLHPCHRFC